MFDRFTERARRAVVLAQEEARDRGAAGVGTEQLLLGLLRVEDGLAAVLLHSLGVALDDVATELGVPDTGRPAPATGQIPFTPQAKRALELALREALGMGHNYIGTEHLLLGVVCGGDDPAARLLAERGATPDTVREELIAQLGRVQPAQWQSRRRPRRFEHRVEVLPELSAERLDELGAEGWQVAAVVREDSGYRVVLRRPRG